MSDELILIVGMCLIFGAAFLPLVVQLVRR
jgi:hypothetical protein